jgi:4-carboxymuconolactone decarboxylase
MRAKILGAAALGVLCLSAGLAQNLPQFQLRGDRFKPLTAEQLTPEQRQLVENLLSGPRGGLNGPFNILLRSPELGDRLQKVGEYIRFKSSLPPRLNEFAILITARAWSAQYEWLAHYQFAMKAGLAAAVADDVASGKRPAGMQTDEAVVYDFAKELIDTHQVSDAHFKAVVDAFGERGAVDLMGTIGYYHMMSILMNVDRYPLPADVKPPLQALN